jgi:hypothetical protein
MDRGRFVLRGAQAPLFYIFPLITRKIYPYHGEE